MFLSNINYINNDLKKLFIHHKKKIPFIPMEKVTLTLVGFFENTT